MFGRTETESIKGYDSTIESKVNIDGNIYTESSLYIAAKLNGEIRSDSDIFIGGDGIINGNIIARNICVAGVVEGTVEASGVLKILNTGKLYGDVSVYRFILCEGAVFEGKCSMSDMAALKTGAPELRSIKSENKKPESIMFRKKDYIEEKSATFQTEAVTEEKPNIN